MLSELCVVCLYKYVRVSFLHNERRRFVVVNFPDCSHINVPMCYFTVAIVRQYFT